MTLAKFNPKTDLLVDFGLLGILVKEIKHQIKLKTEML